MGRVHGSDRALPHSHLTGSPDRRTPRAPSRNYSRAVIQCTIRSRFSVMIPATPCTTRWGHHHSGSRRVGRRCTASVAVLRVGEGVLPPKEVFRASSRHFLGCNKHTTEQGARSKCWSNFRAKHCQASGIEADRIEAGERAHGRAPPAPCAAPAPSPLAPRARHGLGAGPLAANAPGSSRASAVSRRRLASRVRSPVPGPLGRVARGRVWPAAPGRGPDRHGFLSVGLFFSPASL